MNKETSADLKTVFYIMLVGAVIGYLYAQLVSLSRPDMNGSIWIGISIGTIISGVSSSFELFFITKPESNIRALPFYASFIIRVCAHLSFIILTILLVQSVYSLFIGSRFYLIGDNLSNTVKNIGFSVIVLCIIIFWMQMRVFIGSRTLNNLIVGKYYKPQNEERIFMIVDILGSTAATQKIGDDRFHTYLNRLFVLFDEAIHKNGGEVHSYVGDAIIVVWPFASDDKTNERIFKTLNELHSLCEIKQDKFVNEFHIRPEFRAVIHGGTIVVGEMGHRKKQITYLGNTLNLTSRLEDLSKELDIPYLVSDEVLGRSSLPNSMRSVPLGEKAVKGSAKKLAVSQIVIEA